MLRLPRTRSSLSLPLKICALGLHNLSLAFRDSLCVKKRITPEEEAGTESFSLNRSSRKLVPLIPVPMFVNFEKLNTFFRIQAKFAVYVN